jgi:Reverse transcriptase (RNA-dependent DNA polymerase)
MYHAESAGTIAPEQFGSRKHKSAILHAVNKQLTFDIVRQQRLNAALLVLDAKSCYDRISPPIASLALKRQGAPQSIVDVLFTTLDEMKHFIRTAYGDSDITYRRLNDKFHGIGQGNGAGPMIWVMVSSPILNQMRDKGIGTNIRHPDTGIQVMVTAFAFVDDTDIIQEIHDLQDPISEVQTCLNTWADGLLSTGGVLVGSKSIWYLLIHEWINNKWVLKAASDVPGDVSIPNHAGQVERRIRHDPHKSVLALGIMFAPNGSMAGEVQYLREKAEKWAEKIRCSFLKRHEAWYAINVSIMKSVEYPLLATTMTKKQLDYVVSPILKAGLPKAGVCRTIARELVFSSIK